MYAAQMQISLDSDKVETCLYQESFTATLPQRQIREDLCSWDYNLLLWCEDEVCSSSVLLQLFHTVNTTNKLHNMRCSQHNCYSIAQTMAISVPI